MRVIASLAHSLVDAGREADGQERKESQAEPEREGQEERGMLRKQTYTAKATTRPSHR